MTGIIIFGALFTFLPNASLVTVRDGNPMADWTLFGFRMEGFGYPDYPVRIKICISYYYNLLSHSFLFRYIFLCCINGIFLKDDYDMNKIKQKVVLFQTFSSKIPRIREKLAKKRRKNGSIHPDLDLRIENLKMGRILSGFL